MKRILMILSFTMVLCVSLAATSSVPQAPQRGASPWGPDDQRGAANRITPEKVIEAVGLIKKGRIHSLGREYEDSMPLPPGRTFTLLIPQAAPPAGKNQIVGHDEFITAQLGQVGTQMDSLGHVGIGNIFYNGFDRREFATAKGLTKLGIENAGVFLTRGLLLDMAALKRKERLEKNEEITAEDLKQALRRQGLTIRPGDAVLIHTGWGSLWKVDNQQYCAGEPGLGVGAAHFLVENQVTLVGADNWGIEVGPGTIPDQVFPVHQILITQNGVYLLENIDTAALAREKVYEFAFFFTPLKIKGATGSPGNPVAID